MRELQLSHFLSPWLFSTGNYEKAKWNVLRIGKKYFPDRNIDNNFVEQLSVQMEKAESEDHDGRSARVPGYRILEARFS